MPPELTAFWTEHSARPTLASQVSCLACFPADWPDLLGRWGATRAEGYVRTHRARVDAMQTAVARAFRRAAEPHKVFHEDDLFYEMADYLGARGWDQNAIESCVEGFRLYGKGVVPEEKPDLKPVEELSDGEEVQVLEAEAIRTNLDVANVYPKGTYVVAISKAARRLHRTGQPRCPLLPGRDYKAYEEYGLECPASTKYTHACKNCWPVKKSRTEEESEEDTSESSSSSSSSSDATSRGGDVRAVGS